MADAPTFEQLREMRRTARRDARRKAIGKLPRSVIVDLCYGCGIPAYSDESKDTLADDLCAFLVTMENEGE